MIRHARIGLAAMLLAGCAKSPDATGGLTPAEDRQLNQAAADLDANSPAPASSDQGNAP